MSWVTPFTAVVGATATAANWNASGRDNLTHLRAILPDPAGSGRVLRSTSTSAASFANPSGDTVLSPGTVTGDSTASAISTGGLLPNRLVADSFDATQTSSAFASSSITEDLLSTAVRNKLIFGGIIFLVRTAAEIPSGWSRETNLNGRLAIGAGVSFGSTFEEGTNYGSAWDHVHSLVSHTHGVSGFNSNNASGQTMVNFSPDNSVQAAAVAHLHSLSGSLGSAGGNMSTTAWIPPSRAYVYCRRST